MAQFRLKGSAMTASRDQGRRKFKYLCALGPNPTAEELRRDEDRRVAEGIDDESVFVLDFDGSTLRRAGMSGAGRMGYVGTFVGNDGSLRTRSFVCESDEAAIDAWLRHRDLVRQGSIADGDPSVSGEAVKSAENGKDNEVPERTADTTRKKTIMVATRDGEVVMTLPEGDVPDLPARVGRQVYPSTLKEYARELWELNGYPKSETLAKALSEITSTNIKGSTVWKWIDHFLWDEYEAWGGGEIDAFADALGWDRSYFTSSSEVFRRKLAESSDAVARGDQDSIPQEAQEEGRPQTIGSNLDHALEDACLVVCEGHAPMHFRTHEGARQWVDHANDALGSLGYEERYQVEEIEWRD